MMNLRTATPAQIDLVMFPIEERAAILAGRITTYRQRAAAESEIGRTYSASRYEKLIEEGQRELALVLETLAPYTAEYERRGGWTRYLKVVGDGHVHDTTSCSTCFPTTQWARLPMLSGLTPVEMVEAVGDRACSVCYPWAPALPSYRPVEDAERKAKREAREARAAEIAAKREKNSLRSVDGLPLYDDEGRFGRQITTVTEGKRCLKSMIETEAYGYHPESRAAASREWRLAERERIAEALAAKLGGTAAEIIAKIEKGVSKEAAAASRAHWATR